MVQGQKTTGKILKSDERFLRVSHLIAWKKSSKNVAQHLASLSGCLWPLVKHGGGALRVWGCIPASGVGDFLKSMGS